MSDYTLLPRSAWAAHGLRPLHAGNHHTCTPLCNSGRHGYHTDIAMNAAEWNAAPAERKCKLCIAVIRKRKLKRTAAALTTKGTK